MPVPPHKVIVVVDPLRAGRRIPQLFEGIGYPVVCVLSRESASPFWRESLRAEEFVSVIDDDGDPDIEKIVGALSTFDVQCIVAGGESGVRLADRLSGRFSHLPGNDPALSSTRRDKFDMAERLVAQGLRAIPQVKTGDLDVLLEWYRSRPGNRVVLKPLSSAAADGVRFCATEDQVRSAFTELHGTTDLFGRVNDEILAQDDIAPGGTEYTVNSISSRGTHLITDIWRMTRTMVDSTAICVYSDWVDQTEPEHAALADYCEQVLTAVGTLNGAGHSEIMMTPDGPVLIETSSRLEGTCDPAVVFDLTGRSQNSLLPHAFLSPDVFGQLAAIRRAGGRQARHVYLLTTAGGEVVAPPDLEPVRSLPTLFSLDTDLDRAVTLERTNDLARCPGNLYLVSDDSAAIERDYLSFREMEATIYAKMLGRQD